MSSFWENLIKPIHCLNKKLHNVKNAIFAEQNLVGTRRIRRDPFLFCHFFFIIFFQSPFTKLKALKSFWERLPVATYCRQSRNSRHIHCKSPLLPKKRERKKKGYVFIASLIRLALQQYFGAVRLSLEPSFRQVGRSLDPEAGNSTDFQSRGSASNMTRRAQPTSCPDGIR